MALKNAGPHKPVQEHWAGQSGATKVRLVARITNTVSATEISAALTRTLITVTSSHRTMTSETNQHLRSTVSRSKYSKAIGKLWGMLNGPQITRALYLLASWSLVLRLLLLHCRPASWLRLAGVLTHGSPLISRSRFWIQRKKDCQTFSLMPRHRGCRLFFTQALKIRAPQCRATKCRKEDAARALIGTPRNSSRQ
jgi:hypothetical protein